MALLPKRARFVAEYLKDTNAKQAAIRAGYSPKTAEVQGCRLLRDAQVAAAVSDAQQRQLEAADVDAIKVLRELARIAMFDQRSFFDEAGNIKPPKDWTPEQGAVLASFEVIKKNAAAGDGVVDTVHKIRVWDKPKALETLAKHFGLLTEKVNLSGTLRVEWGPPSE